MQGKSSQQKHYKKRECGRWDKKDQRDGIGSKVARKIPWRKKQYRAAGRWIRNPRSGTLIGHKRSKVSNRLKYFLHCFRSCFLIIVYLIKVGNVRNFGTGIKLFLSLWDQPLTKQTRGIEISTEYL